ncbi:alpha/beta hydrolase family protein [Kitasatospora viridis]|uniref:Platelet-activating factor acetylhydrolase isoform II n=1 Tax=Kitasatospora viridis TaxID=281105 RepID=A0A561UIV7_9ACTN|nr:alpha/beta hydrolase [Kitasatospora viridis]TWF99302.1 platelet-activating factor acetylhydrolase isoform II [Kitasatospora viridis]
MTRIRRTAVAAALALVLPLPITAAGTAFAAAGQAPATTASTPTRQGVQLELPRPTGPHAVGVSMLHLVDQDRPDPWVPSAGPRQLMVSMYYPARPGTGRAAPYMTIEEARLFLDMEGIGSAVPAQVLADTRTYASTDARPEHGRYPLVVLSPGFELPRQTLTGLAVDLASRGYVVALVDHTYEDSGTTFPDGQTLGCALCDLASVTDAENVQSRTEDLSFVLDQLTSRHSPWQYAQLINGKRIGMAGHSLGGNAVTATMAADRRVRAGADLDGRFFVPVPTAGLDGRPVLLLGNPANHAVGGDESSWATDWPSLDGWKRWLTVTGSNHVSFTDVPVLAHEAGIPGVDGSIPAVRAEQLTRDYVAAFFDEQLKGIPQPLLDGPSPADPEVVFQQRP